MPLAAITPDKAMPFSAGVFRVRRARSTVTAVDDTRPPSIALSISPRCWPVMRIATWPIIDRPAISTTAHHSRYGLSAWYGP